MHNPTVRSMKSRAVLIEDGAFALFFPSPSRGIGSLSVHQDFTTQHIPTYMTYNYCKKSDLWTLPKSLFRWQNVSCTIFLLTLTYTGENINVSVLSVYVGSYSSFQGIPVTHIKQLPLRGDVGHNKRESSLCIATKIRVGYQMSSGKVLLTRGWFKIVV